MRKPKQNSPRRLARELAVQALYQTALSGVSAVQTITDIYAERRLYEHFIGEEIALKLHQPVMGHLKWQGRLEKVSEQHLTLSLYDAALAALAQEAAADKAIAPAAVPPPAAETATLWTAAGFIEESTEAENSPSIPQWCFAFEEIQKAKLIDRGHIADHTLFSHKFDDFGQPLFDEELFKTLFFGVHHNSSKYRQAIRPLLDRDEKEINPVEAAILLMACHELSAMPETPHPVIINEAIEISKTYGGTDSHKFINGILDKLAAGLRPNHPQYRPARAE